MNVLVIYNPMAGGGKQKLLDRFVQALKSQQANVEIYSTRAPGDATEMLQQRSQSNVLNADVVVAVGGDGTTNEVINGLPASIPLAVFPTGTANVLAKELGISKNPEKNAQDIVQGKDVSVWPGRLNGRRFALMVGVGYDAWVVNRVNLQVKYWLGKGAYVLSMLQQVAAYGSKQYELVIDGQSHDCYSAIIVNGRYYGGSFILSRKAKMTEPSLQVLMFRKPGVGQLLKVLLNLLFARVEEVEGVSSIAAKEVEIFSPPGEPLQMDGDPAENIPVKLAVDGVPLLVRTP